MMSQFQLLGALRFQKTQNQPLQRTWLHVALSNTGEVSSHKEREATLLKKMKQHRGEDY